MNRRGFVRRLAAGVLAAAMLEDALLGSLERMAPPVPWHGEGIVIEAWNRLDGLWEVVAQVPPGTTSFTVPASDPPYELFRAGRQWLRIESDEGPIWT